MSILASAFPDNIVDTRSIVLGAVDEVYTVSGTDDTATTCNTYYGGGAGAQMVGATIPVLDGEALDVEFEGYANSLGNTGNDYNNLQVGIKVNGTLVGSWAPLGPSSMNTILFSTTAPYLPLRIRRMIGGLSAGDANVQAFLYAANGSGSSKNLLAYGKTLNIRRIKKPILTSAAPLSSASATYIGAQLGTLSGGSVTLTGASIGSANANRAVVIAVAWRATQGQLAYVPQVAIGGQLAQWIGRRAEDNHVVSFYSLAYPSGTTANIVASGFSADPDDIVIMKWRVLANSATPYRSQGYSNLISGSNASSWNFQPPVSANSVGILAMVGRKTTSTGYSTTWSGVENVTEDADTATSMNDTRYAGYHTDTFASSQTSSYFTNAATGSAIGTVLCFAAFFR